MIQHTALCALCFQLGPARRKPISGVRTWHKMKVRGEKKKGKLVQYFSSDSHCAGFADYAQFVDRLSHIDDVLLDKQKRVSIYDSRGGRSRAQ